MILVLKWTTAPRQVSWLHWEMMERPTAVRAAPEWEMLKHPVQGAAALLLGQGARGARVGCSGGEWRQPSLTAFLLSAVCSPSCSGVVWKRGTRGGTSVGTAGAVSASVPSSTAEFCSAA